MKELFLGHLSTTLNLDTEELGKLLYKTADDGTVTDELKDDAAEILKGLDVKRVKALKADVKPDSKALQDQYKRGRKEAREELEKELRETYEVESDKVGTELVAEIIGKVNSTALSDDKVKVHPMYLKAEKSAKAELAALKEAHQQELEQVKAGAARTMTLTKVKELALQALEKLNPDLPDDAGIAANWRNTFAAQFDAFDYEFQDDGSPIILKDGKRLEDEHGHLIQFDKKVKDIAGNFFTFKAQGGKGNAGNKASSSKSSEGKTVTPQTEAELWEAYNAAKTHEEKMAVMEAYEKEHGEITV